MSDVKIDNRCVECKMSHEQLIELLGESMAYVDDAEFNEGLSVYDKNKAKKVSKKIFKILELHGWGRLDK